MSRTFDIPEATTYLNHKQQEVQVEIQARQNVLVHDGHQNGGTTVGQNWQCRVASDSTGRGPGLRRRRRLEFLIALVELVHLDGVFVSLLVVGHGEGGGVVQRQKDSGAYTTRNRKHPRERELLPGSGALTQQGAQGQLSQRLITVSYFCYPTIYSFR